MNFGEERNRILNVLDDHVGGHEINGLVPHGQSFDAADDPMVQVPVGADGRLIQIDANPEGYWHRLDALAHAVPAKEIAAIRTEPAFRTLRIDRLALRAIDLEASTDYYRRLLGSEGIRDSGSNFTLGMSTLRLKPSSAEAYFVLAIADFDQAIRLRPDMALLLYVRGLAKQHGGDVKGAEDDLRRAQQMDPDEASSLFNRGIAKRGLGDNAGADADIARARAINPNIGQGQ